MKIVIAGGSGFVGRALSQFFLHQEHEVFILTRGQSYKNGGLQYIQWLQENAEPEKHLQDADVFINLAGVSLNEGRWTEERKEAIFKSRMSATAEINRIIEKLNPKPQLLINASAIGIYPISKAATYTEASTQISTDFLGKTVAHWEKLAKKSEEHGVRVALTRFGVILGKNGGALDLMALPYQFHVGGTLGSGMQWVSWVHLDDIVGGMDFIIHHENISGIINFTAPHPVRMKQFGETIATVLNRKHWFPVPSPLLKIALGEKSTMVLDGQRVLPNVLQANDYEFHYAKIQDALVNLL
ncbi:MAG: TIGR01777 family oxidoreductase [Kurthia sp.]|nr:TIGR01777 family oxidoreductase [Candidatus Kurthia equi]